MRTTHCSALHEHAWFFIAAQRTSVARLKSVELRRHVCARGLHPPTRIRLCDLRSGDLWRLRRFHRDRSRSHRNPTCARSGSPRSRPAPTSACIMTGAIALAGRGEVVEQAIEVHGEVARAVERLREQRRDDAAAHADRVEDALGRHLDAGVHEDERERRAVAAPGSRSRPCRRPMSGSRAGRPERRRPASDRSLRVRRSRWAATSVRREGAGPPPRRSSRRRCRRRSAGSFRG